MYSIGSRVVLVTWNSYRIQTNFADFKNKIESRLVVPIVRAMLAKGNLKKETTKNFIPFILGFPKKKLDFWTILKKGNFQRV